MVVERPHSRRRAAVVLGITSVLLIGACGGKSKSESTPAPSPSTGEHRVSVSTETTAAKVKCVTTPGQQKARIRFVNLYTNKTYPKRDIDIWQGLSATEPCAKKLTTVAFGDTSDYIDITASNEAGDWSAAAYIAGTTDPDHEIVVRAERWLGSEQATMVVEAAEPRAGVPTSAGSDQTFLELNNLGKPALLVPQEGKAALGITSALQTVVKDGAWVAGGGQSTCLRALSDTASHRSNIGGTQMVRYSVDPGSLQLALYPSNSGSCSGAPDIGPVKVDAAPGSATFVFAYGVDAKNVELLVLPIAQ